MTSPQPSSGPPVRGAFIAFEGGEGAGKSSQIKLLADSLRARGVAVLTTHEPGATVLGQRIRSMLLDSDQPISPLTEALLFAADRAEHVATVIRPALERGEVVLCDRYLDSSLAYQGAGRILVEAEVRELSRFATGDLTPDLTVLLDISPELGLARVAARSTADRLERETLEFHTRVRAAFRVLADSQHYLILDAAEPMIVIAATIAAAVVTLLASVDPV